MRRIMWLVVAAALVAGSCGDDGDPDDASTAGETANETEAETADESEADGETGDPGSAAGDPAGGDLPDDFPPELLVAEATHTDVAELGGIVTTTFETTLSYEDVIAFYTDALGEPTFEGGDADGRLGSWTTHGAWAVTVLDEDPTTVAIARVPDE